MLLRVDLCPVSTFDLRVARLVVRVGDDAAATVLDRGFVIAAGLVACRLGPRSADLIRDEV